MDASARTRTARISRLRPALALLLAALLALACSAVVGAQAPTGPTPAEPCTPVSTLGCSAVKGNLPLDLTWNASEGGYLDADGQGTGFTMVQPSTTGAYRPERLDVDPATGRLVIRTTAGIQYKAPGQTPAATNPNSLDNGLGIGVDASRKLRFETTLVNPPKDGATSLQGGLWFGPSQDDYVKLVVASAESDATPHRVQLMREVGGVSASSTDEVNTLADRDYAGQTVRLILVADPGTGTVAGSYKVGDGVETALGQLTVPARFFDGTAVPSGARAAGSTGFAGIFATHRNSTTATGFPYAFGEFLAREVAPPVQTGNAEVSPQRLVTNDDVAGAAGAPAQVVTIRNTGSTILTDVAASLSGSDAGQWAITKQPAASVAAGGSTTAEVTFKATSAGPKGAALDIASSDADTPKISVGLRGLGAAGLGGANEPSLQWILDTYEIPVSVGDDNPATNVIHSSTTSQRAKLLGNEVPAPAFRKAAGADAVTVEPLAVFGPDAANPVLRFGSYTAGSPAQRSELFTVANSPVRNAQSLDVPGGTRSFDPGSSTFGLYSIWPFFNDRQLNSEDTLNTFTGAIPHHVRTYPLKSAAGAVVPNAYVVATEEHVSGFDFQDVVVVVRNVEPVVATSLAEITVENLDEVPFADRLVFNRIQTPATTSQGVHDTAKLRVRNTGTDPLTLTEAAISGPWQLVSPPSFPTSIAPGGAQELTVRFTAQTIGADGGFHLGSLTLRSNDADEAALPVQLAGFWQSVSEGGQEPDVDEVVRTFGYRTNFGNGNFNNRGRYEKLGEEVLSPYWKRADATKNVEVRQLAALHGYPGTAAFYTTGPRPATGSPTTQERLRHVNEDAQSFLPRKNDTARTPGKASFAPATATFGFKVDGEWSDPDFNNDDADDCSSPTIPCGHHLRAWPARDRAGALIPHTYLVVMDYSGINYDFNDNMYVVSNVRPTIETEDPSIPKPCTPIACDRIEVATPYALDFGAARAGTVADKDDQGTGFTRVDPPSNSPGYVKANLDLDTAAGRLAVTTTSGLNFAQNNSLDNGLAVGLPWAKQADPTALAIRTTLVDLPAGTQNNQQGGLWFGVGQDDYVKLVVISGATGTRVQLLRERGGVSDGATDQITSAGAALDVTGKSVSLELLADPATRRVTGTYSVPGQNAQVLGSLEVPASFFSQEAAAIDERIGTSSFAGILASHRQGPAPLVFRFDDFSVSASRPRPSVTASRPANGATGVLRDESVSTDLSLPNAGGIDNATLTADTVRLVRVSDGQVVPANRGTSGGGDVVNLDPTPLLDANTQYRFEITDGLRDASGQAFLPYTASFTTGANVTDTGSGTSTARFERVALPNATAPYEFYSGLTMGPDDKLYAGMIDGRIRRFPVGADGTLGTPETITTLVPGFDVERDATKRALVGIRFEPGSTASNPVLWVSHTTYGFENMPDWGGVITRLSGPDLTQRRDVITGLPRSTRDHLTNGIDFGPDGALYFNQGSINAMGRGDNSWALTVNGVKVLREERALSAATLRLDPTKVGGTLDVRTDEGGTYDPFAAGAPLTVFASGIRNAYDLVWHSNGQLYVPTNGSAAGGNTPGTPSPLPASCSPRADGTYTSPSVPALTNIGTTQHDYLFRAVKGGYYGHPNPKRCEWVLNGGNPTSGADPAEVSQYPVGTQPDRNWRGAAYDFGLNKSPNGVVEYKSDTFGGSLKGKLLVTRYSNSNDVIALTPGGTAKDIVAEQTGIPGLSSPTQGLKDPLDIAEDTRTGNLYVSEYDQTGQGQRILLLRAQDTGTTPTGCAPNSTLPCSQVKATVPKTMDWGADEGGLKDADGQGTGFTMVQPSSGGGSFLPGRLDVDPAAGDLTITSTRGIQFKTATTTTNGNTLDNGVGVGFDATKPTTIQTTLVNPPLASGNSEQAGIWFGPDEDNYAKVVVASAKNGAATRHKVQLLREVGGASALTPDPATTDELNSTTPADEDFSAQTVRLTLVTDPASRRVTGSYRVGTGAEQALGSLAVPASFFDGSTVAANARAAGSTGFAGIFATHRNNTTTAGLDYVFGRFALTQDNQAPSVVNPGAQRVAQGESFTLPIRASDPDGHELDFEARGMPADLTMDPRTGVISGRVNTAATLGDYEVALKVTDLGTPNLSTSTTFTITVTAPAPVKPLTGVKVNFQTADAPVPTGYLRDFGEAFGPRTGAAQGTGYAYGWVEPGTSTPRSLTTPPNGRDRNLNADQRLDTLMHMQGNDPANFNGTRLPATWEIAAPDGEYRVTVAVGDPSPGVDPEASSINVEGSAAISRFTSTAAAGTAGRHQTATVQRVRVTDGRLTLDATGGTNTKINYVDIDPIANTAPVVTKPADRTDRVGDAVSLQVQASDAESPNLVYSATGLPAGLSIDGDEGLISGTIASGAAAASPYTVTVKATDTALPALSGEQTFTWTVLPAAACEPHSSRPCAQVKVRLPYERSFGADQGGLADKDGEATGFTMVQPSGQSTASDPISSAFVPSAVDLDAAAGRLSIDAGPGIQFKNQAQSTGAVNQLKNALGVGLDMPRKLRLETTLVNPPLVPGTGAEQAGLWFGPDQDHYVKLVVGHQGSGTTRSHRINFLRESGALVPAGAAGEVNVPASGTGPNYSSKSVKLILEVDGRSGGRAEAFFEVDGTRTRVGAFENLGAAFFDGSKLSPGLTGAGVDATAGVFATKRNTTSTAPVVFTFDDLSLSAVNAAPVVTAADREDEAGTKVQLPVEATDLDRDRLTYTASGLPEGLSIDPATGVISGTAPAARTEPYAVTVTATDDGDPARSGSASFAWTFAPRPPVTPLGELKVNFEPATTATPAGYVRDSGLPYGARSPQARFGWVRVGSQTPVDLSRNTRERSGSATPDLRLRTLLHMQGDDPVNFAGTPVEGAWELAVPDGRYRVTVAVGDATSGVDPQRDSIRVEGVSAIERFDATGKADYTADRHMTATVTAPVTDGRLTVDAVGGTNTKIDYLEVVALADNRAPVVTAPADATAREGRPADLRPTATDPDGDALAFSATGLPAGLEISRTTGAITGTPTTPGVSTVTVRATDDGVPARSGETTFELTVLEGVVPTVTQVAPADGATEVAVSADLTATFSEPVQADSVQLTLTRAGTAVPGTLTLNAARTVATFDPAQALDHLAQYTARVEGARDDAGNALAAARTWSFTTRDRETGALSASPASVAFPATETGSTRSADVVLRNEGAAGAKDILVSSVAITGAGAGDFSDDRDGTLTLAAGQTATVRVTFAPAQVGAKAATLALVHNGSNGTVDVPLSGTAVAPAAPRLKAEPAALAFGEVEVDASRALAVTVTNEGDATATVGTPALQGADAARFTGPSAGFTLAPGASREVSVTFAPTATGARTATLSLPYGAAAGSGLQIALTGTGTPKPAPATPVRINAGGPAQTVGGVAWSGCATAQSCNGWVSGGNPFVKSPIPAVTGMVDPANAAIYQSEWTGGQTTGVPAGGLAYRFDVPVANGDWTVRLHFADNNQNGIGKRIFDVNVEGGAKELVGLDLFKESGGLGRAIVRDIPATVTDGKVTIDFLRQVENAMVSGIEILPAAQFPADTSVPRVTDLAAVAGDARVDLSWRNPDAADLRLVRVLRSVAGHATSPEPAAGQTQVYEGTGQAHASTGLANGTRHFFTVFTRDAAGNWSAAAEASATPAAPAQTPGAVRINAGGPAQTIGGTAWRACSAAGSCSGFVSGGFAVTKEPAPAITGAVSPANAATYVDEWTGGQTNGVPAGGTAFTFDVPVAPGEYDVRLHFAENHQNGVGKRLFDVEVEGQTRLSNFDIFATAGGMHQAFVRELRTSVTDGKATIRFIRRVENAAVMGIEIVPVGTDPGPSPDTTAPGPVSGLAAAAGDARVDLTWANPAADFAATRILRSTQGFAAGPNPGGAQVQVYEGAGRSHASTGLVNGTPYFFTAFARDAAGNWSVARTVQATPVAPPQAPVRINAGGPALTVGGVAWRGCATKTTCSGATVVGGFPYKKGPLPTITGAVAPASAAIYQTEWTGGQTNGVPAGQVAYGFDVPVANGTYLVRLHFADNNQNGIGKRLFDVQIDGGALELSRFDIFAQAGGLSKAIVREFTTTVADGKVDLDFIRRVENAKVDGIEVLPVAAGTVAAPAPGALRLTAAASSSGTVTVSGRLSASGATLRAVTATRRTARAARRIVLEGRPTGSSRYRTVAVAVADRTGAFRTRVSRGAWTVLRARYSGDRHVRPAVSRGIRIRPGA